MIASGSIVRVRHSLRARRAGTWLAMVSALVVAAPPAGASVLTFDYGVPGSPSVDQTYGDRVSAAAIGSFTYGTAGGFTPNVVVDYLPNDSQLIRWDANYGDLINVLEYEPDGQGPYDIIFTADPGFLVTLTSFDLGGWPNSDYILPSFQILSGATVLLTQTDVLVQGDATGPRHTSIDLSATPLTAQTLTIRINQQTLGGNSDNIGIDNIQFSQSGAAVPEPSALALTGLGGLGLLGFARRRGRRRAAA